jgi:F0F1-type ATP synthase assembly protein I
MKKKILDYIMHTDPWAKIFWKLWFWYGIRKAMKERKAKEAENAKKPRMTNDEYWEKVHNDRNNNV